MNGYMSDGGPAFPETAQSGGGLTVREYIAAHIMGHVAQICCVAHMRERQDEDEPLDAEPIARAVVQLTDALMAELRNS